MKELFGKGLFITKDKDGNNCKIGDIIKISVGEGYAGYGEERNYLEEYEYMGQLILRKTSGIVIKTDDGRYLQPRLGRYTHRKYIWELLKSNNE